MTTITKHQRWKERNPEQFKVSQRKGSIKHKYGMEWDEYLDLVAVKGNVCWICGTDDPGWGRINLCVDHCHDTGKVRGLLCYDCNLSISKFHDDPELIEAAIAYLERP